VDGAEAVDGGLDDGITVFAAVLCRHGFAAVLLDFGDDVVGVHEVVYDDFSAERGEEHAVCSSKTGKYVSRVFDRVADVTYPAPPPVITATFPLKSSFSAGWFLSIFNAVSSRPMKSATPAGYCGLE
jgi:hypothetical protein